MTIKQHRNLPEHQQKGNPTMPEQSFTVYGVLERKGGMDRLRPIGSVRAVDHGTAQGIAHREYGPQASVEPKPVDGFNVDNRKGDLDLTEYRDRNTSRHISADDGRREQ